MNKYDKGYKERLMDLRKQLADSVNLGLVNPELFQQQIIQMLNGIESIKLKSQSEIERLTILLGEERGRVKACNDMGDLVVNIIAGFVNQEKNRLVEDERLKAEAAEREELIKEQQEMIEVVISPPVVESTPEPVPETKVSKRQVKLPPGVNVIKSNK